MLVEAVRLILVLGILAASYRSAGPLVRGLSLPISQESAVLLVTVVITGLGYIVAGVLARAADRALGSAERKLARRHASEVVAGTLGLLVGLGLGALLAWPLLLVGGVPWITWPLAALILVLAGSFGMRFATRKRMELFGVLGVDVSYSAGSGCLLDTSAVVDGRVIGMYRAGLLPTPLWVPAFIVWELQGIADASDPERRRRGRRGLDVLTSLREAGAGVKVWDEDPAGVSEPDAKLVVLAKRRGVPIVTADSNLASAAQLQGVRVLSLHALAELGRPPVLPGEQLQVSIVKEGRERGQGVGYLEDGTMVVVERGRPLVGEQVTAEVTSVLQTSTGRMVFARLGAETASP